MEIGLERFQTMIDASKKASQRGDLPQAERLLKSSLKQAERDMAVVECAMKEIVESLSSVYELQGKTQELEALKERLSKPCWQEQ